MVDTTSFTSKCESKAIAVVGRPIVPIHRLARRVLLSLSKLVLVHHFAGFFEQDHECRVAIAFVLAELGCLEIGEFNPLNGASTLGCLERPGNYCKVLEWDASFRPRPVS
ncbi:hypothetical protein FHW17_002209 [Phyllobacterium sp. P30BS-XVII]|nr:hypothetical protein [Phyllobacterium sp. P30BS-XVII]